MPKLPWFVYYLIAINLVGAALMFIDKRKAIRHKWRISEKTLFLAALLGGSAGCIFGMYTFRHKTRHLSFVIGMPAIFLVEMLAALAGMWVAYR